jgi:hypothetical protein
MRGWLFGVVVLVYAAVLRFDPEARRPKDVSGRMNTEANPIVIG